MGSWPTATILIPFTALLARARRVRFNFRDDPRLGAGVAFDPDLPVGVRMAPRIAYADDFIRNARRARQIGDEGQYQFVRNALKKTAAVKKMLEGVTTYEEVIAVTG